MEQNMTLRIDTRLDTGRVEKEIGEIAASLSTVVGKAISIISGLFTKVKGQFKLMDIGGLLDAMVESIFVAIRKFSGNLLVDEIAGQITQVCGKFLELQSVVDLALISIASVILTTANQLLDSLTSIIVAIATQLQRVMEPLRGGAEKAAKSQQLLTKSVTAAGRAAQLSLAAFDELNIVQRGSAGGAGGSRPEKPELPELELPEWLQPLWEALAWGYKNVLEPLKKWFADKAVPAYLELLASAGNLLREALEALKPLASWLWESFLVPLGQWSGEILLIAMDGLRDRLAALADWFGENKESIAGFWETLQPLMEAVGSIFGNLLDGIKQIFASWYEAMTGMLSGYLETWTGLLTGDWAQAWEGVKQIFESGKTFILETLGTLWQMASEGAGAAWAALQELFAPVWEWFLATIITPLSESFGWLWEGIALAADICWQAIKAIWEPVSGWLMQKIITPVWNLIKKLWDDMLSLAKNGLEMVQDAVKSYLQGVITLATGGVNVIISLINRIIDGLNSISVDIPDWVPEYGGRSFGINIPYIPKVTVPKLATGAVIPANREFLAVLGDQKQGRNLEAPESLIRQIVREETASLQGEGALAVNLLLDGDVIYRAVVDRQLRQGYQTGGAFTYAY